MSEQRNTKRGPGRPRTRREASRTLSVEISESVARALDQATTNKTAYVEQMLRERLLPQTISEQRSEGMSTLAFLAPDGVVYSVRADPWRRPGRAWDNWEAHVFAPYDAPLPGGLQSPLRPPRGHGWTPDDALEAAALALTQATAPAGQPMQTVLIGTDPRLFKWATSIPASADWRPAAEALFTRHERWLAEGTPNATDQDKTADYHLLNIQTRREDRGYLWITMQLTRDGQHSLSSHGYYSVVVHQPEAR